MSSVTTQALTRHFDQTVAVDNVDLHIQAGELFFLLGPSGCGKTTLLRMIAGLVEPTRGTIRFDDRDVTHTPPNKRRTGMVFQSYALWPHMTVQENVAYGLRVRRVDTQQRRERVDRALHLVHMHAYAKRKPNQLSGGQQQRVALARALVVEPEVLLLDEPLSNLDAQLRLEMRSEIRRICKQIGATTIYVTHDQKEALSMADRIALLREGQLAQVGEPRELYERPTSRFVAQFLGETNFLPATIESVDQEGMRIKTPAGTLRSTPPLTPLPQGQVICSIRPEHFTIQSEPSQSEPSRNDQTNTFRGRRLGTTYLGEVAQHRVELAGGQIVDVLEINPDLQRPGDQLELRIRPDQIVVLTDPV